MALIAEYGFEQPSGGIFTDLTGNGYDLTMGQNAVRVEGHGGSTQAIQAGSGVQMDLGAAAYRAYPGGSPMQNATTWAFWAKLTDMNDGTPLVCVWNESGRTDPMNVYIDSDGSLEAWWYDGAEGGGSLSTDTGLVEVGTWVHIAAVFAPGTSVKLYVNGVAAATWSWQPGSNALYSSWETLLVGSSRWGSNAAIIDDLRIYNEALSQAAIAALMDQVIDEGEAINTMKVADAPIKSLYIGAVPAARAYLGDVIVYQGSATTPPVDDGGDGDDEESNGEYPTVTNTGVPTGQTLTAVPGQVTSGPGWAWMTVYGQPCVNIYDDGAVLSGLDIDGPIYNNGAQSPRTACSNVVIENCRIRGTGEENWVITLGPNSTVRDCEIGGGANGTTTVAIGILSGYYAGTQATNTILRCNIHHVEHGMRVDGNTIVQDSYFHDFIMDDPANHTDAIMCTAGTDMHFIHNTIEAGVTNSGLFIQWQTGNTSIGVVEIRDNYFQFLSKAGAVPSWGVSYENKGVANPAQTTITNNLWDLAFKTTNGSGAIQAPAGYAASGNVYTDGSVVVVEDN